jgi:hypothetical protein
LGGRAEQAACRISGKVFLDCKDFNTSVDKFVEIIGGGLVNFPQVNVIPRFALFVCNEEGSASFQVAATG